MLGHYYIEPSFILRPEIAVNGIFPSLHLKSRSVFIVHTKSLHQILSNVTEWNRTAPYYLSLNY